MIVYCTTTDTLNTSLGYFDVERLSKHIPAEIRNSPYVTCPAFTDLTKNTYVIRSPIDLEFSFNMRTGQCRFSNEELFNEFIVWQQNILQIKFNYGFFSEKPLKITQLHPFLHNNTLTNNGNILSGEFDIGKWFRPVNISCVLRNKDILNFKLNRGDVCCYFRFNTDEKIEFKYFNCNKEIKDIMVKCTDMKKLSHNIFSLKYGYQQFEKYNLNKHLLKEIKKQFTF